MVTTPLPTQDYDPSDHGSETSAEIDSDYYYVVRLTPQGKYSEVEVEEWLRAQRCFTSWVLSTEKHPKLHYHLVISLSCYEDEASDIKPLLREFLYQFWPENERKRGWGNAQYNCQVSTDPEQAITYAIKEKTYIFYGQDPDYMKHLEGLSFTKNATASFSTEFQILKKEFLDSDMDTREFMTKFCSLKAKYGQMVNLTHAYQYSLSLLFLREPSQVENYVENYLYKQ